MPGASCSVARVRPSATKRSRPQVKSSATLVERGCTVRAGVAGGQQGRQIFFDGHFAAKLHVARPVGDAEAALAQYRDDFISPDLRLGRECRDVDVARACGLGRDPFQPCVSRSSRSWSRRR